MFNNINVADVINIVAAIILSVVAILLGKKTTSGNTTTAIAQESLAYITSWAYKFVVNAKNKLVEKSGSEKFAYVLEEVKKIAEAQGYDFSEEQLSAIVEEQYEKMMKSITGIVIDKIVGDNKPKLNDKAPEKKED